MRSNSESSLHSFFLPAVPLFQQASARQANPYFRQKRATGDIRCGQWMDVCLEAPPPLIPFEVEHAVACYLYDSKRTARAVSDSVSELMKRLHLASAEGVR